MPLRWRLFTVFLLLILVTLVSLSLFLQQNNRREIRNYMFQGGLAGTENWVEALQNFYQQNGSWNDVAQVFTPGTGTGGGGGKNRNQGNVGVGSGNMGAPMINVLLTNSKGDLVYNSLPANPQSGRMPGWEYRRGLPLEVGGEVVGYLLPGTEGSFPGVNFETELLSRLNQATFNAAIIAGVVAVLLALILGYTFLKPIQQLTSAANKLGQGDLSQRVPVRGSDELANLAVSFNLMAAKLEDSEKSRREITADIAHELRTPLAVQRANLEALQDGIYPMIAESLTPLVEQNTHLTRLVEDLRTLALADSGELEMHFQETDLVALVESVIQRFDSPAAKKQVHLRYVSELKACMLVLDSDRIVQIFNNLLQNALRYTPAGGDIQVDLRQAHNQVEVSVMDSGNGIPADALPYLFKRFYRGDKSRSKMEGGTGLGLAIAYKIAEAHHATLKGTNNPAGGAIFTLRIPQSILQEEHHGTTRF